MIKLSPRLAACAEFVSPDGTLLDVGTDHALLPCCLCEAGRIRYAYASDISDGPLAFARETVRKAGLAESVCILKSDGLKDIPCDILNTVTDVSATGMGGELIAKILTLHTLLRDDVNLILAPNTRAPVLRRFLHDSSFDIISETVARDGGFLYPVINARRAADTSPRSPLTDFEAEIGKLDKFHPESREYLENERLRLRTAAKGRMSCHSERERSETAAILALALNLEEYLS